VIASELRASAGFEPLLSLQRNRIDLWLVFFDSLRDPRLLERYRKLLSAAERAQEPRFFFDDDRRRFVITRALVRTVLSRYSHTAPECWSFAQNAYGRPQVVARSSTHARISFNVSHTKSLILLGVTGENAIGVDVENVSARRASLGIADHYFAADEVAALHTLPAERRVERFFELWTLKESYIKARGMGLSIPLDAFSFQFPHDDSVEFCSREGIHVAPATWRFWQLRPAAEYLAAVCVQRSTELCPELVMRSVVPLESETRIACPIARRSV
jgi:4'-phosphopantetheinyl transferase